MQRRREHLAFSMLLLLARCAALTPGDTAETDAFTGLSTSQGVPTVTNIGADKPATPQADTSGTISVLDGPGKASTVAGMALRWHAGSSRCLTRTQTTPTLGDNIVMADCASAQKHAFSISILGYIRVSADMCLGFSPNNTKTARALVDCNDGNSSPLFALHKGAFRPLSSPGSFVPNDAHGAVGSGIHFDSNAADSTAGLWDVVGVGNLGGTAWILNDNEQTQSCLTVRNGKSALGTCSASVTEQRWRLNQGVLQNDTGQCLTCDMNTLKCALQGCKALTTIPPNDQRWTYAFISFLYRSVTQNGNSYSLGGDAFNQTASLDPNDGTAGWTIGTQF